MRRVLTIERRVPGHHHEIRYTGAVFGDRKELLGLESPTIEAGRLRLHRLRRPVPAGHVVQRRRRRERLVAREKITALVIGTGDPDGTVIRKSDQRTFEGTLRAGREPVDAADHILQHRHQQVIVGGSDGFHRGLFIRFDDHVDDPRILPTQYGEVCEQDRALRIGYALSRPILFQ